MKPFWIVVLILLLCSTAQAITRDEMIVAVEDILNDPTNRRWSDTTIAAELNNFIWEVEDMYGLNATDTAYSCTTGVSAYVLPAGLLHATGLTYRNTSTKPELFINTEALIRKTPMEFGKTVYDELVTKPMEWCLRPNDDSLRLWPVPLMPLDLTLHYNAQSTAMPEGDDAFPLPKSFIKLAQQYAAARCLERDGNQARVSAMDAEIDKKLSKLGQIRDWKARHIAETAGSQ